MSTQSAPTKWLSSNLKKETEEPLVTTQDQATKIKNHQKVICGKQVKSNCKVCSHMKRQRTILYLDEKY